MTIWSPSRRRVGQVSGTGQVLSGGGRDCSGWEARGGAAGWPRRAASARIRRPCEECPPCPIFPLPHRVPPAGRGHHHLHDHVAPGPGVRGDQPVAGFPDFSAEDVLFERVAHWMRAGHNQYAPMAGVPPCGRRSRPRWRPLRRRLRPGARGDGDRRGHPGACSTAVAALVHPGDEVTFRAGV